MKSHLSTALKTQALKLGFQKVGITPAVSTPKEETNLKEWIDQNHHGTMGWIEKRKEERGNIFKYFPDAKSIISVGMNYYSGYKQSDFKSDYKISNCAWGDDYHDVLKSRLYKLLDWLEKEGTDVKGIVCGDTSPVMDKVWAQKAGLGWQGKHTNLISSDYGSWLFLGELILDIELEYDAPFPDDLCGTCTACIDACPTHALDEFKIFAEKCISYLSIEHRGQLSGNQSNLYNWIYGCDICQDVCPWNQKFSQKTEENSFQPKKEIIEWNNENWHILNEDGFRKLFKGSAVKRTKYSGLSRNIKINK
ncbi:MAG: tRNA epoxyqueuosine(34) reductase QueG [Fidelibacterota bacterium]